MNLKAPIVSSMEYDPGFFGEMCARVEGRPSGQASVLLHSLYFR